MRITAALVAMVLSGFAFAQVPAKLGYQGRLLKADGTPEAGVVSMSFGYFDAATGGTALGCDVMQVALNDGYYAVLLGGAGGCFNGPPPISSAIFDGRELYLEVSLANTPLAPRQRVVSVAYAHRAGTAANVRGGTVEATSVSVGGASGVAITPTAITLGGTSIGTLTVGAGLTGNGSTTSPLAVSFGTGAGTAVEGNDPRLSDARAPTAGSASYIQNQNLVAQAGSFQIDGTASIGGPVGIGTAAPTERLQIHAPTGVAEVRLSDATTTAASGRGTYLRLRANQDFDIVNFETGRALLLGAGGTERLRIEGATGNVGVGTATPAERLDVSGNLKVSGIVDAVNNLEIVQVADARLTYTPNAFACNAGEWCNQANAWGVNRFSTNGRYTNCTGEANCSSNSVELTLNSNAYRSALLSHLDWDNTRVITVYLSFDGGTSYQFHKAINTQRAQTPATHTSAIRCVASNLPLGGNVRVRLVAAKGRLHFEGFGLAKMVFPETDSQPFRSIARAGANGPADSTCDTNGACGPSPLATRVLTFVKALASTAVRFQYTDTMRAYAGDGVVSICRWYIRVDGVPCPSGEISGVVYAGPNDDPHRWRSVSGYCAGLAPGEHTAQVYVSNYSTRGRCYTGWPGGETRWTLEAEEVQ